LKDFASAKLDTVGAKYENEVYIAKGLGAKLGQLGTGLPPCRPRQDKGLPQPEGDKWHRKIKDVGVLMGADDYDKAYIALLLTAVHALDRPYQAAAKKVCEGAGGECKAPPPKGFMRMMAKMLTDHAEAAHPRPAENIDTNRVAWTFETPEQLRAAFEGAAKEFGQPLRAKNGLSPSFNALEISKGYRNILANYRYAPKGLTWGKVSKDPKTKEAWKKLRELMVNCFLRNNNTPEEDLLKDEWKNVLADFDAAASYLSSDKMAKVPCVLVVEIQYMLSEYMEMRKYTHSWYKIVRADNAESMVADFNA